MTYISALQLPCECTERGVIEPLLEAVEADPLRLPVPDISCQLVKKQQKNGLKDNKMSWSEDRNKKQKRYSYLPTLRDEPLDSCRCRNLLGTGTATGLVLLLEGCGDLGVAVGPMVGLVSTIEDHC